MIQALTDLSTICTQNIENNCNVNSLSGVSGWTGRDDQKYRYWHGDYSTGEIGCKCKEDNSCNLSFSSSSYNYQCHCDTFSTNITDSGTLKSLTKV